MDPNQELAKKLISNGQNLVLTCQEGTVKNIYNSVLYP
jgi:hypothetical protein